ncbi:hypothetical protein KAH37_01240 [bacterium]|nr:hypothetical protein [bacterium]
MSLFSRFIFCKNRAKLAVFVATILLVMNLFASVDTITILNGSECEQTGVCHYRMQFSSWFSINPSYPEDYDYYRNIKDPQNNWHSTNGTLLDCMSSGVCTAIASDHVDFNYTHPDSGAVVVNMQVEDYWGGDYAAATLNHSVELFTVPDPGFQACITAEMDINGYTNINQITTLSCNSIALTSIEGVELLTSLESLNIAGSSVSDLSPVLQSSSLLSFSFLEANGSIYIIMDDDLTVFKQWIREHIACRRLYIPSCDDAMYVGDCPSPFFTDRCNDGTCHYNYSTNEPFCNCDSGYLNGANSDLTCISWLDSEMAAITTENPFIANSTDSWNNFNETETYACILGTSDKLGNCISKDVISYEGKFKSWEYNNGEKEDIEIYFYAAKPANVTEQLPLLIVSHGGGGFASHKYTKTLAAELNMFVIYYSGPGRGPYEWDLINKEPIRDESGGLTEINFNTEWSTGTDHTYYSVPDKNDKFFDSSPDPRGSWMWGHTVAAMRAITLAAENDDIDMENVAMLGGSAGGIATLLASSVDDRIKVAVPTISSLAIEDAVASQNSWINALRVCTDNAQDDTTPDWMAFIDQIVGKDALITRNRVPTLFLNGATDEYFPLNALNSTYDSMANKDLSRFSIQYNRGHDWVTPQIGDTVEFLHMLYMRLNSGTYHWLKNHLDFPNNNQDVNLDDDRLGTIPNIPTVTTPVNQDGKYKPEVIVYNPNNLNIEEVNFYYSSNEVLEEQGLNYYKVSLPMHFILNGDLIYTLNDTMFLPDNFNNSTSFYFADVTYTLSNASSNIEHFYSTFYLSSKPKINSTPYILPWTTPTCNQNSGTSNTLFMW